MNERNVCIGDKIRVGEALLQVFFLLVWHILGQPSSQ
jgi:hypothetical protein